MRSPLALVKQSAPPRPKVYNAEPTPARMHADHTSFFRGIRGPLGSGKSTACCMEIVYRALRQAPGPDGMRRTRWGVVRNTYPELKSTTIKTWTRWMSEDYYGPVVYSSPIIHNLRLSEDTYLEMLFVSIDREEEVRKLLSLDITGIWLNEARELTKGLLDMAGGRVGRFPETTEDGFGPTWSGIIADTNSMGEEHWWYHLAEEETPEGYTFYDQPDAMSPKAENLKHLESNYYQRQLAGKDKNWVNVHIHNRYGIVKSGKPVYDEDWNDEFHVSQLPMVAIEGVEIILGWDFGLTPACIIGQVTPFGQLRILEEICGEAISVDRFITDQVKPVLETRYRNCPIVSVGDPAGEARKDVGPFTPFSILDAEKIPTEPAPSNLLPPRLGAVRWFLGQSRAGMPLFVINKACVTLRRGFNSGYKYRQISLGAGVTRYLESPDKNIYSHAHDGLQYLCLHLRAGMDDRISNVVPITVPTIQAADLVTGY